MLRIPKALARLAVFGLSFGVLVAAQVAGVPPPPPPPPPSGQIPARDPALAQLPTERRIPIGTSMLRGTVVTADTGRPIPNARVTVNGQVTANVAALAAAASSAQSGGRGGATGQVQVQIAGPTRGGAPGGIPSGFNLVSAGGVVTSLNRTVMTDASGQFSFPKMPAGQFTVNVTRDQFLAVTYGQTRTGGQGKYVAIADGQTVALNIAMPRGGVIAGMVIGPDGEPQRNAQVRGWRVDMSSGFKRLQSTQFAMSDDRGLYRMAGLQPGEYFVSATPNPNDLFNAMSSLNSQADLVERAIASAPANPPAAAGATPTVSVSIPPPQQGPISMSSPGYLQTYAPSSMTASGATPVTVGAGEERNGVDIRVQLTQATTIQGSLTSPLETGVTVQVTLLSDDQSIDAPQPQSSRPDPNGVFTFRAVPPGTYTVLAQTLPAQPTITVVNGQAMPQTQPPPALTDAQKQWGKTRVTVAGEPTASVSVSLRPGRSISGVVVFEMSRPPDLTRTRLSVSLGPAPSAQQVFFGNTPQAQIEPDGRFTLTGVMPGRYILRASGTMKSAMAGGQDTLDFPLVFTGDRDITDAVLTLTDQVSELSGVLTDSAGKPAPDYTILVATTDNRYWLPASRRIVMTRPGPDGKYSVRNLPAGNYQVAAVFDMEPGAQYDPEFLRTLGRASVPVTITEGGKATQDLRVK